VLILSERCITTYIFTPRNYICVVHKVEWFKDEYSFREHCTEASNPISDQNAQLCRRPLGRQMEACYETLAGGRCRTFRRKICYPLIKEVSLVAVQLSPDTECQNTMVSFRPFMWASNALL
jgi:hypothetical protein